MGRVLSPYSNPIQAGVDTFTQLNSAFNQNDRLALEEKDHEETRADNAQRRQLLGLQTEYEAGKVEDQKVAKEHAMLLPYVASALTKLKYSADNGTLPEFTPQEHGAIQKLQKDSPYLSDDPQGLMKQAHAVNGLLQATPQLLQGLEGHAKSTGQSKFIITDQNAPGVVQNFNEAFGKAFGGDEYHKLFIDVQAGTITPAKEDGTPLTDKDGKPKSIPFDQLKQVAQKMQQFGSLALASHAQIGGDEKRQKEVEAALSDHTIRGRTADALDEFKSWKEKNPDAEVNERRNELTRLLTPTGMKQSDIKAYVKDEIPDKEVKPRNLVKIEEGDPSKPGYKRDVLVDPDNVGADGKPKVVFQGQGRQEFKPSAPKDGGSGSDDKWNHQEDRREAYKDKTTSRTEVKDALKAWNKAKQEAAASKSNPMKGDYDTLRSEQNRLRRVYEQEMQRHMDDFGENFTGGGDVEKTESRAKSLSSAGKTDGGKKAPVNAIKAAVATATSRSDAVAILKRQGYTHDENGKPL